MKDPRPDDLRESVLPRDWAERGPLVDRILDAAPETRAERMELPSPIKKGYVLAKTGDLAGARRLLDQRLGARHTIRAFTYLGLGETTNALDAFEEATKAQEIWHVLRATSDPIFDSIRESDRFKALLQSVRLPANAATRTSQK